MTTAGEGPGSIVPTVTVRASATVDAVPDEAHLHVDLSANGRSSDAALESLQERVDRIDQVCDSLGIEAADRTSEVRVSEDGERDGGRWLSKGYRATATIGLVVRDTESTGSLVNQVVASAGPAIRGPRWRVTPDHPARLEACAKAAAHARAKATAYAEALGLVPGEVMTVSEPNTAAQPITARRTAVVSPAPAAAAPQADGPAEQPAINLHPGTQEVRADVEVVFRLT
jgi:uncharacterized protein YggE